MSYDVETTGLQVGTINGVEYKPTSHIEIDSTKVDAALLASFEEILYGVEGSTQPSMPLPAEVFEFFGASAIPSIELNKHYIEVEAGGTVTLTATIKNSTETADWESSADTYASVSGGVVTGENAGTAIITASITDSGVTYNDTCTVKVNAAG